MIRERTKRLGLWLKLTAVFTVLTSVLVPAISASATESVVTDGDLIWDVGDAQTDVGHTGQLRALVWDIEEYDGRVYVAGKFLNVYSPGGAKYSQPYLAAFDLETGDWIPSFTPQMRGPVYAIEITPDGIILAGGEIPGGVQAIDTYTGTDFAGFSTNLRHLWGQPAIFDIEIVGDQTYLGGRFTLAGDVALQNLARINTRTGAIDPTWRPTTELDTGTPVDGGINVYGLAVDPSRDRVYLAGKFGSINGDARAFNFAVVDIATGALKADIPQGLPPGILSHREANAMWQHDVQFRHDRVYLGGQAHQTLILDAATLTPLRSYSTNRGVGDEYGGGDTQVLHLGRTTIWAGCHCWGSLAEYPIGSRNNDNVSGQQSYREYQSFTSEVLTVPGSFGQQPVRAGYGIDIATGDKLPFEFNLNGQAGAWALLEDSNGRLWMGGQFTRDRGRDRALRGLTRFAPLARRPTAAPRDPSFGSSYHAPSGPSCVASGACRPAPRRASQTQELLVSGTARADVVRLSSSPGWSGLASFLR